MGTRKREETIGLIIKLRLRFIVMLLCACEQNILKGVQPIKFIFGENLPSDTGMKLLDFEKSFEKGLVGGGRAEIWPNHKREREYFPSGCNS